MRGGEDATMRVLLATDGSEDARAATAWLGQFPLPPGSALRVVSAVSAPPSVLDIPTVRDLQQSMRTEAQRVADGARTALTKRFATTDVHVAEGDARHVILAAAEEWHADLAVLGARGLGAVAGLLLGSVSLAVARHAPCSVLVVKGAPAPLRGVLLALDASPGAAAAAAFLARLPLDRGCTVRLLGVVEPPHYPATTPTLAAGMVRKAIEQIVRERRAAIEPALENAAGAFGAVKRVERQIVVGHPVDEIVAAAARPGIDLVVVGARGLGAVQRMLLGSVSEDVLRHVDRTVLVVKPGSRGAGAP
jgi:nucleotide-binding universal stress UspA family protein